MYIGRGRKKERYQLRLSSALVTYCFCLLVWLFCFPLISKVVVVGDFQLWKGQSFAFLGSFFSAFCGKDGKR
jgi:hypothetical protein